MRKSLTRALLVAAVGSALGVGAQASAAPSCISYRAQAPFLGTRQGQRCVPMPNQFDLMLGIEDCQGIPPIGVEECVKVVLWLPSP